MREIYAVILMTSPADDDRNYQLCDVLGNLNLVSMTLQFENTIISDVRALIHAVDEKHPSMDHRRRPTAKIVLHVRFESKLIKIQERRVIELTLEEMENISILKHVSTPNVRFESKLIKVQERRVVELTSDEKENIYILKHGTTPNTIMPTMPILFSRQAITKCRTLIASAQVAFLETSFILPTSNIVERFNQDI